MMTAIFNIIDQDGNGIMSRRELFDLIRDYASYLHLDLYKGWMKHVRKWYNAVNTKGKGINQWQLEDWFKKNDVYISDLKSAIKSLSK